MPGHKSKNCWESGANGSDSRTARFLHNVNQNLSQTACATKHAVRGTRQGAWGTQTITKRRAKKED